MIVTFKTVSAIDDFYTYVTIDWTLPILPKENQLINLKSFINVGFSNVKFISEKALIEGKNLRDKHDILSFDLYRYDYADKNRIVESRLSDSDVPITKNEGPFVVKNIEWKKSEDIEVLIHISLIQQ